MRIILLMGILLFFAGACRDKTEPDTEVPVINIGYTNFFPKHCDTIYTGESFTFRAQFSDNSELGSYSIDIHHNFDHHTHSTEVEECEMDAVKQAVNPFLYIATFDIPEGLQNYNAVQSISVPAGIDTGDYHIMIRLTDKEGWQAIKGLGLKILSRKNGFLK